MITTTLSATTVSAKTAQIVLTKDTKPDGRGRGSLRAAMVVTVSVRKQQHQAAEASVRHLRDVGGTPADGLNGGCRKRFVLTLHIGLKQEKGQRGENIAPTL